MNAEDHDLLLRIHENTKDIPGQMKKHEELDNQRFLWGAIALVIIATANGVLPQLLTHFKLGV